MRVIQLIAQTVLGGAEICGHNIGVELAGRGHAVQLLGNRDNGPLGRLDRPPGMGFAALDRRGRLDPRIVPFLAGWVRRFRPDVIHAHNFEAYTWARALGLVFPRLVVVCHVHRSRLLVSHSRHRVWLDRTLFRRADVVIVLNRELEAYLRDHLGVPVERLHVLPNGIDMARFAPPDGSTRDGREVVCVASLTDVKNHRGLLDAWRDVVRDHPDARLTLVGDGPLRPALESLARESGIAASVEFAGLHEDVAPILRRASIFVLPSHREAMPLSLLEAMSAGLACVASDVGGIPEVVVDGATGKLVPPGDPRALAAVISALLASAGMRDDLGAAARREVAGRYSLSASVDRLEELYGMAIARRKS